VTDQPERTAEVTKATLPAGAPGASPADSKRKGRDLMELDKEMSLMEHLKELRDRLMWVAGALFVGTAISMAFAKQALELLITPLGQRLPQVIAPTENFVVYFRVALIGGVLIAMPMILYQLVRFVLPGLLPNERKWLYTLLPTATLSYAVGVAFAALIMLPAAINFMQTFLSDIMEMNWTLDNYIKFVTTVLFWMGVVFETPLVIFFLAKLGVVNARQLAKGRKWAVLGTAVVAAVVTPTPDPVNMMIVMIPLYLLYEVGIILARLARPKPKADASASAA